MTMTMIMMMMIMIIDLPDDQHTGVGKGEEGYLYLGVLQLYQVKGSLQRNI